MGSGTVQFSFIPDSAYTPDSISALVVSFTDAGGNSVCENSVIELHKENGKFISQTLPLAAGNYTIVKYMVINASGKVVEVTPSEYSAKASEVEVPLPITFTIVADQHTVVSPQAVLVIGMKAQEFGYTSFQFNYDALFDFKIHVYLYNDTDNVFESTEAFFSLINDSVSLTDTLLAADNTIKIKDVSGRYIMRVSKDGFQDYVDTLDQSELMLYYKNAYSVLLNRPGESNLTLTTDQSTLKKVVIWLGASDLNKIFVSWGDGALETNSYKGRFSHEYSQTGTYRIFISGRIDLLTSLTASSCALTDIYMNQAININSVDVSRNPIRILDLSYLSHLKEVRCVEDTLETINLNGSDSLETFYCSDNELKSINISSKTLLKTLYCDRNYLTSVDLSHNTLLETLSFSNNSITSVDLSKNTNLKRLEGAYNKLSSLNIAANTHLEYIEMTKNKFGSDVMNKALVDILAGVKTNGQRDGKAYFGLMPYGDGESAMNELVNNYGWLVQ
jgi:hypothetical protein